MSIGLFLDVDNTLTRGFIQHRFAMMVDVEADYKALEDLYEANQIMSEDFGDRLIGLFNRTRFNEQFAYDQFATIPLKPFAAQLLQCASASIEIYLVSSGPSYYVLRLAERYKIPSENVLCSEYKFDRDGKLAECNAVTPKLKRDFREKYGRHHALTIGVGDDEIHDASFLDGCDIGLLTPKTGQTPQSMSDNHLWAPRLSLVLALVTNLDKKMRISAKT